MNRHRQLIRRVFQHALREATFGLPREPGGGPTRPRGRPAAAGDLRARGDRRARPSCTLWLHRKRRDRRTATRRPGARGSEEQDAAIFLVAAYRSARGRAPRAALVGRVLRSPRKLVVSRTISANVESTSTKSRPARARCRCPTRPREHSIACRSALATSRDRTTSSSSIVPRPRRLDGSAVRRRMDRARQRAGLRPLRFHDLRHTYGSAARRSAGSIRLGQGGHGPRGDHDDRALPARAPAAHRRGADDQGVRARGRRARIRAGGMRSWAERLDWEVGLK